MVYPASLYWWGKGQQLGGGGDIQLHVQLFCDTGIMGGCCGTISTWCSRGYSVNHIIIGFLETVGFNGSLSFEIWVDLLGPWRSSSSGPGGGR